MANPQLKNGYTKIANDILDALAKKSPGFTEGQVLWCVIRKTYGWNKKEDYISISQLIKMTNKSRRMVIYAIQNLESKKMIFVSRSFREINKISFNKKFNEWISEEQSPQYKKLHLVQKVAPSATFCKYLVQHSVNEVQKVAPTKETITKETIQKKEYTHLEDLTDLDFQEISNYYNVPIGFVRSKYDDIVLWVGQQNKPSKTKGRNWRLTLMNWVKKDAINLINNSRRNSNEVSI